VTGSEKDTSRGFTLANDMAGCWRRKNAILTDQKLLRAIGSSNLCNQLNNLGIPEATVTTDDEE
jgi:hypothetical protein